jgi:adenine phosphoribosyltransferase
MKLDRLVERFEWVEGHADVWRLFSDAVVLRELVAALGAPFAAEGVTKVAGVESRGFILGAAVAAHIGVGFVAIRKAGGLFPGAKIERQTAPDYRGLENVLRLQRAAVSSNDRVLLVDDWVEIGSQALTAKALIEEAGAAYAGCSVIVDDTDSDVRRRLAPFAALVHVGALGPDT